MGLISNNVLHTRERLVDSDDAAQKRCLFPAPSMTWSIPTARLERTGLRATRLVRGLRRILPLRNP